MSIKGRSARAGCLFDSELVSCARQGAASVVVRGCRLVRQTAQRTTRSLVRQLVSHTHARAHVGFMNGTDWGKEMQKKLGRPEVQTAEIDAAMARVKAFLAKHLN